MAAISVAVLGCGPAGLLAAEGAKTALRDANRSSGRKPRVNVTVFSLKRKSEIHGAQYLHEPIPGVTTGVPHGDICYYKVGQPEGYAAKVYGDPRAPVSWTHFAQGLHPGFELEGVYDKLWRKWEGLIVAHNFSDSGSEWVYEWGLKQGFDLVISTIPLPQLCRDECHVFPTRHIWITNKAATMENGDSIPYNCVVYNGNTYDGWYRSSNLFGHASTEYGHAVAGATKGIKVLSTNCDCFEKSNQRKSINGPTLVTAGRWGKWQRGVLVHHAYHDAARAVDRFYEESLL